MADLTIADVLDVDYPDATAWNAAGSYLAVPIHGDDGQHLRIASMAEPTDPWLAR